MQRAAPAPAGGFSIPRPLVGAATCAVLMALTAWTVLAGGWADNAGGAVVVAIAAAVEGALLAGAAAPRLVTIVAAPLLALAAIVPTTIGAMPYDGNVTVGHIAARYASALFGGLGSNTDWSFTVGLCAVLWLCGYWLAWMSLRERRGVLAVLPIYAVLATNVLNTKTPDNVALPEALAVVFTLLVLAGSHLEALQSRWSRRNVSPLPGTRTRFAASVAATAVVLTIAALLIPSLTTADISARFFPGSGSGPNHNGGGGTTPALQFANATVPGGPLLENPQQVLTYTTSNNAPVYLGVEADTDFSDGNWFPATTGQYGSSPIFDESAKFPAGPLPRNLSPLNGGVGADESTVTATIKLLASATGGDPLALFPGDPEAVDQPGQATGEEETGISQLLSVESVTLATGDQAGSTIVSQGFVSTATATQLEAAGIDYPQWLKPYLQLSPDDGSYSEAQVEAIAKQWVAGTTNPYDEAVAIVNHLHAFTYTLNPPDPPQGEWAILYFLTKTQEGYCQYFAATMGAMLRILGIPARLITGYAPGITGDAASQNGTFTHIVTTADAHVWVEAYFPGYGWIPFEPTPAVAGSDPNPFPRGQDAIKPPPQAAPQSSPKPALKPGFSGGSGTVDTGTPPPSGPPAGTVILIVLGALLLCVLGVALYLVLPRSLAGVWRRLEVLGVLCGARRRPSETYLEYTRRFETLLAPTLGASLHELGVELGRADFAADTVEPDSRRRVLALWHRVVAQAPRLLVRTARYPRWRHRLSAG